MSEPELDKLRRLATVEHGLCTFVCLDSTGSPHVSVVNAGIADHPVTGEPAVAAVLSGAAHKAKLLRVDSRAAVLFRHEWDWAGVRGRAQLFGPDDPVDGFDSAGVAAVLRDVFTAAGGTHDDWDEYDAVMAQERRVAVFVSTDRVTSNPGSTS
ncbi:MAG TPA: pyridoxamine 5'-phosphate oxidase [Acidimicrobiaceae bacterium]|nr:pyridoxamine 5'-phosphate oxidase [Acidimicrobiaceae bacterium]HCB37884.1 pyridoxamine 5'-phosphate oxidase [Acidimicrobiaceae bacterium]